VSDLNPGAVIAGYLWAVVVGGRFVSSAMQAVRGETSPPKEQWHRAAIGLAERVLVVTATLLLSPELVAGWLVLKVANSWRGWGSDPGRFNRFASGTVLSLSFGAAGGGLAYGLSNGYVPLVVGTLVGPLAFALLLSSLYQGPVWWQKWWGSYVEPADANAASARKGSAAEDLEAGE
jgi:hypothetical protein